MINIQVLRPRAFAWQWRGDQRVLLVGLWFFAVGFDLGLRRSAWFKHFSQECRYCHHPLNVNARFQAVKWHGRCRRDGRRSEFLEMKREKARVKAYNLARGHDVDGRPNWAQRALQAVGIKAGPMVLPAITRDVAKA